MSNLTALQKKPTNIEVDRQQAEVRITWADGFRSIYTLDYLRQICPCAVCNEVRNNQDPLRLLTPDKIVQKGELRAEQPVEIVGNYALQFFWADGHNTGIYSFDYLRHKSP